MKTVTSKTTSLILISILLSVQLCLGASDWRLDIRDYGAIEGGKSDCTKAIQKAIDTCQKRGGGMVIVPPGKFLTSPIFLKSNVNFHISAGATLLGSTDINSYPPVKGRWEGIERTIYASLITGHDLENVSITGRGVINARGSVWWDAFRKVQQLRKNAGITEREPDNPKGSPLKWPRPRTINIYNTKNLLIRDIKIIDSPAWTIHPVYCENVTVDNVTIIQPYNSPNTDGVNPDSCKNVRISNCFIDCGDDCITIKSGYNEDGLRVSKPCENIAITNCTLLRGRGGVVIGSETSGGVRNVTISNCIFDGTKRGLRIKTSRGRGNVVEHITASNLVIRNVETPFSITMKYRKGMKPEPVTERTPRFRDFNFSNISVSTCDRAADIIGLEEMPIQGLKFSNILVKNAGKGFDCLNAKGITLDNVTVNTKKGPAYMFNHTDDIELHRISTERPNHNSSVITLKNADDTWIHGCKAPAGTKTFIELKSDKNLDIKIENNRLDKAAEPVKRPSLGGR